MTRPFLTVVFFVFAALICGFDITSAQWTPTSGPGPHLRAEAVTSFAVFQGDLYVGAFIGGVFRTSDAGVQWTGSSTGLTEPFTTSLIVSGNNLIAGTAIKKGIFLTQDGWNWMPAVTDSDDKQVMDICACGNSLISIDSHANVRCSTDNGAHWTFQGRTLPDVKYHMLASHDTILFAGVPDVGVFRSSDYGVHWTDMSEGLPYRSITRLAVLGRDLFAGTFSGMLRSSDDGASWTAINKGMAPNEFVVASIATYHEYLFIVMQPCSVYFSRDRGDSWTSISDGLLNLSITAIGVAEPWLYCGADSGLVWRRSLSEVVSVNRISDAVPSRLMLEQNYPNPFNPTTTIEFSVPESGPASVKILNVFGAVVATLVSEDLRPGTYKTSWDATGFASGVYFYRLEQGRYVQMKKLTVVR